MIVKERGHDITLGIMATCYIEQVLMSEFTL